LKKCRADLMKNLAKSSRIWKLKSRNS
jgi:hypothetical protein